MAAFDLIDNEERSRMRFPSRTVDISIGRSTDCHISFPLRCEIADRHLYLRLMQHPATFRLTIGDNVKSVHIWINGNPVELKRDMFMPVSMNDVIELGERLSITISDPLNAPIFLGASEEAKKRMYEEVKKHRNGIQ
ncbi:hypothetical protein QR680_008051 [Steinernema hermaphroditum]|uniref:FHA domain-containing protein n=1 Tax=Steinernema hermaphroditum TaxID=289476 RepID=A0AA39M756_9BILA|nr:hypothetical protein QR680_008051 [Steinernema hermaphroditum]